MRAIPASSSSSVSSAASADVVGSTFTHTHTHPPVVAEVQALNGTGRTPSSSTLEVEVVAIPNNSYQILVSPQKEAALAESVPFTPRDPISANTFKYYCPLCMEFYKSILKSNTCCGNYICLGCCIDYLGSRNLPASCCNDILNAQTSLRGIPCPSCSTIGFSPALVLNEEAVRDYHFSDAGSSTKRKPLGISNTNINRSPVRIGDSFEELKRKMIPFQVQVAQQDDDDLKNKIFVEKELDQFETSQTDCMCTSDFIEKEARDFLFHILGQEGIDRLVQRLAIDTNRQNNTPNSAESTTTLKSHAVAKAYVQSILDSSLRGRVAVSGVRLPPLGGGELSN